MARQPGDRVSDWQVSMMQRNWSTAPLIPPMPIAAEMDRHLL
jgi:hypothetical protein